MLDYVSSATSRAHRSNSAAFSSLEGKEKTIRLLRATKNLLSRKTVWALEDYELDGISSRRAYTALSYFWGSGELTKSMVLNGLKFYILDSVHAIFETIESDFDFSSGSDSWWWIDSLCINQNDMQERSAQVKLMGRIYRQADRTLGWFGRGSNYPEPEIHNFTARGELALQSMFVLRSWREDILDESKREVAATTLKHLVSWSAIEELFERPWWTRVWTLQEYLIPTKFEFWCGNVRMPREILNKVIYILYLIRKLPEYRDLISEKTWLPVWNRRRIFMWHEMVGNRLPFVALVAYGSDCHATDAKDRIYSVLDLVKRDHDKGLAQPCYDKDYLVSNAYIDFAKAFIKKHDSLDIICFADIFNDQGADTPELSGLPTWVPNWAAKTMSFVIPVLASQTSNPQIGNFRSVDDADAIMTASSYRASGRKKAIYDFENNSKILRCKCIFIDTLEDTSRNPRGTEEDKCPPLDENEASQLLDDIARTLIVNREDRYLSIKYTTGQFYHDIRAFCLIASKNPDEMPTLFLKWYNLVRNVLIRGYAVSEICSLSLETPVFAREHRTIDISVWNKFFSRFVDVVQGMRKVFVVTQRGRMGMAGHRWRDGDRICVLRGCNIPMLLRRKFEVESASLEGMCYEFIGECYLEGFMEGQAIVMVERGELVYKDIVIV